MSLITNSLSVYCGTGANYTPSYQSQKNPGRIVGEWFHKIYTATSNIFQPESLSLKYAQQSKDPVEKLLSQTDLALLSFHKDSRNEASLWINEIYNALFDINYESYSSIVREKLVELSVLVDEKDQIKALTAIYVHDFYFLDDPLQSHRRRLMERLLAESPKNQLAIACYSKMDSAITTQEKYQELRTPTTFQQYLKKDPLSFAQQISIWRYVLDFLSDSNPSITSMLRFEQARENPVLQDNLKIENNRQNYAAKKFIHSTLTSDDKRFEKVYAHYKNSMASHQKNTISPDNKILMNYWSRYQSTSNSPHWNIVLNNIYSSSKKNLSFEAIETTLSQYPKIELLIEVAAKLLRRSRAYIFITNTENAHKIAGRFIYNKPSSISILGVNSGENSLFVSRYPSKEFYGFFIHELVHWIRGELSIFTYDRFDTQKNSKFDNQYKVICEAMEKDRKLLKNLRLTDLSSDEKTVWNRFVQEISASTLNSENPNSLGSELLASIPLCFALGIPETTIRKIVPNTLEAYNQHFEPFLKEFAKDSCI